MTRADPDAMWLTKARTRVAAGAAWERSPRELERSAEKLRSRHRAPAPAPVACPFCESWPPLEVFRRYELAANTPLRYCLSCYGFWAAGDSLVRGVADRYDDHPALVAGQAPRRCRACNGQLKPDGDCTKCKRALPLLNCPACAKPMERVMRESIAIDACALCHGLWFDMGEITAVFDIPPPQGLAASTVDEHATDDDPPAWAVALQILLGLFLRF